MTTNNHTYVKIIKDNKTNCYNVILTKTYDTIFGHKENVEEIPFCFTTLDGAKDFVSILPSNIKKCSQKTYKCEHCHICYNAYETYELTVGDYKIYVKWNETFKKDGIFYRETRKPYNNIVYSFYSPVVGNRVDDNYEWNMEYPTLSELVKKLNEHKSEREKKEKVEEYNYELVSQ